MLLIARHFCKKDYFWGKLTNMEKRNSLFFWIVLAVVSIGMITRVFGLPANVSPMLAVILFGAAYFSRKSWSIALPIGLYFLVDLYLNNVVYAQYFDGFQLFGSVGVYVAIAAIIALSIVMLRKVSIVSVFATSLTAAILFFLVTNFFSMLILPEYTKDLSGLMMSYEAAVPFFRGTLVSTMVYSAVLFTSAELILKKPTLSSHQEILDAKV